MNIMGDILENIDGKENFSKQKEILKRDMKDSRKSDVYDIQVKKI